MAALFAVLIVFLVGVHVMLWRAERMPRSTRTHVVRSLAESVNTARSGTLPIALAQVVRTMSTAQCA